METIRVNMTPCDDVQTIHASQDDNEAREWGFELHNNGEKIDSSSITDQLVFKAYEGGTEEILPTNGSVPTTAPFLGDIRYPQGLLTDQEFTYRQSPTESDGLAKITDIKGNTLVWNQQLLAPTTNASATASADGSFRSNRCTFTYDSATHIVTITALENMGTSGFVFGLVNGAPLVVGHKYLQMCDVQAPKTFNFTIGRSGGTDVKTGLSANTYHHVSTIKEFVSSSTEFLFNFNSNNAWTGTETVYIKNAMLFDLTQMGLDITDPSDFTSLFPLSYYSYNQGSLLSFNGTGLKTTGKNLYTGTYRESFTGNGITFTYMGEGRFIANGTATNTGWLSLVEGASNFVHQINLPRGTYTFSTGTNKLKLYTYATSDLAIISQGDGKTTIVDSPLYGVRMLIPSGTVFDNTEIYMQIEFGDTATEYEPYISNTTSLPISTYFPTGMKSAGSVYDELTESKAITRICSVDLGSLEWSYNSTYGMYSIGISNSVKKPSASSVRANAISSVGTFTDWATFYASGTSSGLWAINTSGYIGIATTETNSTTFKNSLQGVYLYYELATPTEASFTTASLVTENGEVALANENGVLVGKCTEELSAEPGFHDAKIKLSDSDGECYSNKLQLHVERSPQ